MMMDQLSDKFSEARELLQDAVRSQRCNICVGYNINNNDNNNV